MIFFPSCILWRGGGGGKERERKIREREREKKEQEEEGGYKNHTLNALCWILGVWDTQFLSLFIRLLSFSRSSSFFVFLIFQFFFFFGLLGIVPCFCFSLIWFGFFGFREEVEVGFVSLLRLRYGSDWYRRNSVLH